MGKTLSSENSQLIPPDFPEKKVVFYQKPKTKVPYPLKINVWKMKSIFLDGLFKRG